MIVRLMNLMILNYHHLKNANYPLRQERVKGKDKGNAEEKEEEMQLTDHQNNKVMNIANMYKHGIQPKIKNGIGVCLGWCRESDVIIMMILFKKLGQEMNVIRTW